MASPLSNADLQENAREGLDRRVRAYNPESNFSVEAAQEIKRWIPNLSPEERRHLENKFQEEKLDEISASEPTENLAEVIPIRPDTAHKSLVDPDLDLGGDLSTKRREAQRQDQDHVDKHNAFIKNLKERHGPDLEKLKAVGDQKKVENLEPGDNGEGILPEQKLAEQSDQDLDDFTMNVVKPADPAPLNTLREVPESQPEPVADSQPKAEVVPEPEITAMPPIIDSPAVKTEAGESEVPKPPVEDAEKLAENITEIPVVPAAVEPAPELPQTTVEPVQIEEKPTVENSLKKWWETANLREGDMTANKIWLPKQPEAKQ